MLQLHPQYAINTGSRIHSVSRYIILHQSPSIHLCPVEDGRGPAARVLGAWTGASAEQGQDAQPSSSFLHEQLVPGPDNLYQVAEHSKHLSSQAPTAWTPVQKHWCQKCTCISSSASRQHHFYRQCCLRTSPDTAAACCKRSTCQHCFFSPSLMNRHTEVSLAHGLDGWQ